MKGSYHGMLQNLEEIEISRNVGKRGFGGMAFSRIHAPSGPPLTGGSGERKDLPREAIRPSARKGEKQKKGRS